MRPKRRQWNMALFVLYCALMLWLLFDRNRYLEGVPYWEQVGQNISLIPFHTIRLYARLLTDAARPRLVRLAVMNLFGNIFMFLPLGFFLPTLWQGLRRLWRVLLLTAAIVTAVELIQMLTLVGSCDIDDLILNLLGAALGYGLFRLTAPKEA